MSGALSYSRIKVFDQNCGGRIFQKVLPMPARRSSGRYLFGQKLSDYQIEKLIDAYASGMDAKEVAKSPGTGGHGRDPNTATRIFALLRKRLMEIGFYIDPRIYLEPREDDGYDLTANSHNLPIDAETWALLLRGYKGEAVLHRVAEILYLAKNQHVTAGALARDIKLAIKCTGPLNRPPQNLDIWAEHGKLISYQTMLGRSRRAATLAALEHSDRPEFAKEMVAVHNKIIASQLSLIEMTERDMMRKVRARRRAGQSAKPKRRGISDKDQESEG